jgi:hypothetical protein
VVVAVDKALSPTEEVDSPTSDYDELTIETYSRIANLATTLPPTMNLHKVSIVHLVSYGRKKLPPNKWPPGCQSWTDCELKFEDKDPQLLPCCGKNGQIQLRMTAHTLFSDVLRTAKRRIEKKAESHNHMTYKHAFRCLSGVHRSVAMPDLVASCLRLEGVLVIVEHLTLGDRDCGCPRLCKRAQGQHHSLAADGFAAHQYATRMWRIV